VGVIRRAGGFLTQKFSARCSVALPERQQSLEEPVGEIETSVGDGEGGAGIDGTDGVTATTARLFEMDYLGRIDTTTYDLDELALSDGRIEITDGYWDGRSERRTGPRGLSTSSGLSTSPSTRPSARRCRTCWGHPVGSASRPAINTIGIMNQMTYHSVPSIRTTHVPIP